MLYIFIWVVADAVCIFFFFFSSRRRHTRWPRDWSSDVCSSDLTMPISVRRHVFVVLLGREFKTFDNMIAFARSVNVVVNLNDLPHLPAIVRKGLEDNNEFYRVFREMLTEVGKR